jgi:hypothetical protein
MSFFKMRPVGERSRKLAEQEHSKRLTAEEAKAKVTECREMAARAIYPEHRITLEHMAEAWERIARALDNGG